MDISNLSFVLANSTPSTEGGETAAIIGLLVFGIMGLGMLALFIVSIVKLVKTNNLWWIAGLVPPIMVPVVGILAAILIPTIGGVLEDAKMTQAIAEQTTDQHLVAPESGMSISVPIYWDSFDYTLNDAANLESGYEGREEYLMVISESTNDYTFDLLEYSQIVVANTTEILVGVEVEEIEPFQINGMNARQYVIDGSIDNINFFYLYTIVESSGYYNQIIQWSLASKKEDLLPLYKKIAATARMEQ